ncbi:anti-sigma regulatory factor (Ser/Thr protein kinase) [Saccharomonospora amisosensis]|uniref:Anti-sigma regulatory factor (Ser/Thr protein kinase) n=1 Tax=Saccharomonospora amisosensis TaxID=1128677 RepID=A0A7X5USX4_9PSEU|nr:anti-sigma regulatory factor (Ser/Thr protein kinase) [Saccharomonospora amisosensis]
MLDGLDAGVPVAVVVPGPNLDRIEAALGSAARQVRLLDMTDVGRNAGRLIPSVLHDFADAHHSNVRIVGEPIWPERSNEEYAACVQHEALLNAAFAGSAANILCPYDASRLSAQAIADAHATHPIIADESGTRASKAYAPDGALSRYNLPLTAPSDAEELPFDLGSLTKARHFAVARGAAFGLSEDRLDDLALAVAELCANSVQHGGGTGTLWVWREQDHVVAQVHDRGHLKDPLAGRRPVSPHRAGGRGLLLVHQVVDLVRTHSTPEGTTTRVYLRL